MTTNAPTPPFDIRALLTEYTETVALIEAVQLAGEAPALVTRRDKLAAQIVAEFERLARFEAAARSAFSDLDGEWYDPNVDYVRRATDKLAAVCE